MQYLYSKLMRQRARYQRYRDYYEGRHQKLVFSQARYHSEFGHLFAAWSDNFSGLIIDSVNERMAIDGFRMAEDDQAADKDARQIWQRNFMDAEASTGNLEALINGVAYAVVWANAAGEPTITVESPTEVVVQYRPGSRRELEAGAKFYTDDWGREYGTLWLPGRVFTFTFDGLRPQLGQGRRNPLGQVPVVPLTNRTALVGHPVSDLAPVIPLQDAINKVTSDALVASEFAAWPQRYVTGLEIQEDDDGRPIEPFRVAIDKLLQAEDPQAKFGQFEAADLGNYVVLVDMLVQHLASITRIPFHYMLANKGQAPSGESVASAEAGLIAKARERMLYLGECWERVMRLAFKVKKDTARAEAWSAEVIWRDPENRTEAQHMDALMKRQQLGVPRDQLLSDAGYTPQQIERFREMRIQDAKDAAEIQKHMPQQQIPAPGPDPQKARSMASKPPQGNAGNQARKQNEIPKR
jgi:hypothetical protein